MRVFILVLIQILSVTIKADFSSPTCEVGGTSCLDCYTQKFCLDLIFMLVQWSTTSCATVNGHTPFCDPASNTCTNSLPSQCTALSFYTCPRDGLFPDLTDCYFYYQCTNNVSEEAVCADNYVYKQQWGKCVFELTDSDCITIPSCTSTNLTATYPGDPSLYYQCQAGVLTLSACAESEWYNLQTNTCESICQSVTDGSLLANQKNCSSYYSCQNAIAVVEICASGLGFNPNTNQCEWGYQNLCNELALLDDTISEMVESIPIYGVLWTPIKTLFNALNFNPVTLILAFGVSDTTTSTIILVADYIFENGALPPSIISVAINIILPYLPEPIKTIVETILNVYLQGDAQDEASLLEVNLATTEQTRSIELPFNRKILKRNDLSENKLIRQYLEDVLKNFNLETLAGFQGKTPSQVLVEILRQFFKVPEAQLPMVTHLIQLQIPALSKELNKQVGLPLFKVQGGKVLKIDPVVLDGAVYNVFGQVAQKLYPTNRFLQEIFKTYARQLYLVHHDVLVDTVSALELSFEKI